MSIKPNNHTIGRLTQATSTHFDKLSDQGSVQATSSVTDFVYDKSGNNLHNNAKYDPKNNQLLEDDNYIYRYNKQGSLISKQDKSNNATTEYIYNKLNQLTKVKNQTQEISFTYNALNQRVTKSIRSTITGTTISHRYLYHNDHIVAILNNKDNSLLATIIHHPNKTDTPLSITNHTTNKTYYYHRDHQGSIIALSNEDGDIVEEIVYDGDYGKIQKHTTKEPTLNPYGYTGREIDMNDIYYYRAIYYDPHTQRFLSLDPIEFDSGDFNWYRYVANSPVNFVDPWGLLELCKTSDWFTYHKFWCDGNNRSIGFYPTGDLDWYGLAPGQYYNPDPHYQDKDLSCVQYDSSNCITKCIMNYRKNHKAPRYNLYMHNCRDEADKMYKTCVMEYLNK